MSSKDKGIGNEIYDGSASFGRFMAWIGLFMGGFIGLIIIIIGFVLLFSKNKYTAKTNAIVKEATCNIGKSSSTTQCLLTIKYTVNGKEYEKNTDTQNKIYNIGNTIVISYDPQNPDDFSISLSKKIIGLILIGVAILIIGAGVFQWYITKRFKFAASAQGVGTAFNMVDRT